MWRQFQSLEMRVGTPFIVSITPALIFLPCRDCIRLAPTASTVAAMSLGDALTVVVSNRRHFTVWIDISIPANAHASMNASVHRFVGRESQGHGSFPVSNLESRTSNLHLPPSTLHPPLSKLESRTSNLHLPTSTLHPQPSHQYTGFPATIEKKFGTLISAIDHSPAPYRPPRSFSQHLDHRRLNPYHNLPRRRGTILSSTTPAASLACRTGW